MTVDLNLGDTQRILTECRARGCTRQQTAYILATAFWESARTMKPVREAFWLSEKWRRLNLRYYPWYGRGYVQITWQENYRNAGVKLGRDLTADPDVVMQPEVATPILVRGMMEGWFTGKPITKYVNDNQTDFHEARRVVNGVDKAREIAGIAEEYDEALKPIWSTPKQTGFWGGLIRAILKLFGKEMS